MEQGPSTSDGRPEKYDVVVTARHTGEGEGRTIAFSLQQDGKQLDRALYDTRNLPAGEETGILNYTVEGGKIRLAAFPQTWHGVSVAEADKVLDVTKCGAPVVEFRADVSDGMVRLSSNCD